MRILLASSELYPYSKTGGLADMVASLAKVLARLGHRVGVVTPLYRGIPKKFPEIHPVDWRFGFAMGDGWESAGLRSLMPSPNLTIYFVDHPSFFDREGLYTKNGTDYPDNARRFVFFSKCVANLARYLPWQPEVVNVHDWQTALAPVLLRHQKAVDGSFAPPPVCLTIHNLAYQGVFPQPEFALTHLPHGYFGIHGLEYFGQMNCLKGGIQFADMITTVSPRYAREITTPEYGCGLDGVLRERSDHLVGILNGVDYEEWKTTENPHLQYAYSASNLAGKTRNKKALQAEIGLEVNSNIPLFGSVTRLAEQKGIDIQLEALGRMLSEEMQFALLGTGDPKYEAAFHKLAKQFPDQVSVNLAYDSTLAHRIEAGCDFFLMPSRFEPCGLNQMYSLHYGTIPIVRATGGLDDSVIDLTEDEHRATGIKFGDYSASALTAAIRKALAIYQDKPLMRQLRRNGMAVDFSLERKTSEYLRVYQTLLPRG